MATNAPLLPGRQLGWYGHPPVAEATGLLPSMQVALWRLGREEQIEFVAEPMTDILFVCAHVSGSIEWDAALDGRTYVRPCLPGTANMLRPGERASVRFSRANADVVHFLIPTALLAPYAAELTRGQDEVELLDPMNTASPEIASCARRMRQLLLGGSASRLDVDAVTLSLVSALVRSHSSAAAGTPARGGLPGWRLARTLELLHDRLDQSLSIGELADAVGLSTFHFAREFRRSTGLPPAAFHRQLRCERAAALLATSAASLAEIATAVGYADQQAFARAFRTYAGVAPAEYRRLMRH